VKSGCRGGHKTGDYIHGLYGQKLHLPTPKNCRTANGTFCRHCDNISVTRISLIKAAAFVHIKEISRLNLGAKLDLFK
jgi:hypothetical protein